MILMLLLHLYLLASLFKSIQCCSFRWCLCFSGGNWGILMPFDETHSHTHMCMHTAQGYEKRIAHCRELFIFMSCMFSSNTTIAIIITIILLVWCGITVVAAAAFAFASTAPHTHIAGGLCINYFCFVCLFRGCCSPQRNL